MNTLIIINAVRPSNKEAKLYDERCCKHLFRILDERYSDSTRFNVTISNHSDVLKFAEEFRAHFDCPSYTSEFLDETEISLKLMVWISDQFRFKTSNAVEIIITNGITATKFADYWMNFISEDEHRFTGDIHCYEAVIIDFEPNKVRKVTEVSLY